MKNHLEVVGLEATRDAQGFFTFSVAFDGPADYVSMPVTIDALVDYAKFQREVLERLGMLYRYGLSEGREPLHANELWKEVVATFLRSAPVQLAAVSPVN